MKIKSEIIKIECTNPTLDFIEEYFKKHKITPVRWAIVDVKDNVLTLDCAILD